MKRRTRAPFVPVIKGRINKLLKVGRLDSGLKQIEVAEHLGLDNSQYLSNIERGLCPPSMEVVSKLVDLYNLDPHQVVDTMAEDYAHTLNTALAYRGRRRR